MKIFKKLFGKNDHKIHVDEIAMKQGNVPILLSEAVIVESGSNENGSYIKFGDGTMECWHYRDEILVISVSRTEGISGYYTDINWEYPKMFNIIDVALGGCVVFNDASARVFSNAYINHFNDGGATLRIWSTGEFNRLLRLNFFAIGRWK